MRSQRNLLFGAAAIACISGTTLAISFAQAADNALERGAAEVKNEIDQATSADKPVGHLNGVPLADISNPQSSLASAQIKSQSGESLGEVHSIALTPDGKVSSVHVEYGGFLGFGEKIVAVDADKFVYVPERKLLVASVTAKELQAMPEVSG